MKIFLPRHIKKTCFLLAVIALSMIASNSHGLTQNHTEVTLQNGLSFQLPAYWQISPAKAGVLFYAQDHDTTPGLRMSVINLPGVAIEQAQIRQLSPEQFAQLKSSWGKLKGCEQGQSQLIYKELTGLVFLEFSCQHRRRPQLYRSLQLALYHGRHSFMVSFEFLADAQQELAPQLKQIIESMVWLEPTR